MEDDDALQLHRLLVHSAKQVVQVVDNGKRILLGNDQNKLAILDAKDGRGISIVVNGNGNIEAIGRDDVIEAAFKGCRYDDVIDCTGKCVIPGLVDGHSHAVWTGDRVHEFAMKLAGATYLDIHNSGGGIHSTVRHVLASNEDNLYSEFKGYAHRMLESGTTLLECKTGYGLTLEAELKMLRVLKRARVDDEFPVDLSITYCAAHAVPKNSTPEAATRDIVSVQLPAIGHLVSDGELDVDNVDVFCEEGVFDVDQTRKILEAGIRMGFNGNFHAEELHCLHSAEMGAALGVKAMSHLEEISDEGIESMARECIVGVMLPTTAYNLRLRPPPARRMIDRGVPLALGSDFNPNAHCLSMPLVMNMACVLLHMTMEEALVASTINSAASIGRSATHGSLEAGKVADMIILDAPRWEHLVYQFGSHNHVISHVIRRGRIVHRK